MRDPKRIDRIIEVLKHKWKQYPDLRLGQLILNVFPFEDKLYNLEDNEFLDLLLDYPQHIVF